MRNMKEKNKKIMAVAAITTIFISVFFTGMAISLEETDEVIMLVRIDGKLGSHVRTLEANLEYSIFEEYDGFLLIKTSEENKNALQRAGYHIETLENRGYVGLNQYSFDTKEGEPEIPENLKIRSYPYDGRGQYIVQFIGPIRSEWLEELTQEGVILHEFRHRYNFIVEMDLLAKRKVERLDYVNWIGIYQPAYRFDHELLENSGRQFLEISIFENADPMIMANEISNIGGEIHSVVNHRIRVEIETEKIETLTNFFNIKFITEGTNDYRLLNAEATWIAQTNIRPYRKITEAGVTGKGQLVTVMDSELYGGNSNNPDHEAWADPDGNPVGDNHRKIQEHYVPEGGGDLNNGVYHGTHVSGTVLGNSPPYGEYNNHDGNALDARLIFQDIDGGGQGLNVPPDMYNDGWGRSYNSGSRIHTNSWGGGTGYTGLAIEADQFNWDHKDHNVLFAMGNSGAGANTLSAQPEGKNTFSIGGVTNYPDHNTMYDASSRGYADDGRIKPTVLHVAQYLTSASQSADGYSSMSGTSMSCPGVAGQLAQIRQYYEDGWYPTGIQGNNPGFNPSSALVRATIINGAVEITGNGAYNNDARFPNGDQGYGRSMLDRVLHINGDERKLMVYDSWNEGVSLNTGNTWTMDFQVDDPTQELEVTLAWTDYPGPDGADQSNPAIVNDLDLELSTPGGTRYVGNAFTSYNRGYSQPNPTTNPWSGQRTGEFDGLNVEENILLIPTYNGVESGTYTITVSAHQVSQGTQPFALVVTGGVTLEDPDPRPLPPTNPIPVDGATGVGTDPELSVYVEHEDGNLMDVHFYDASNNGLIGTDDRVNSGARASVVWNGLNLGTTYSWYAVAEARSDGQTATSATWSFTTAEPTPPSITLTRPTGGEIWTSGTNEDIMWSTTAGDGTITGIDLDYSIDGGTSWTNIVTGTADDGVHTWLVPDEPTIEAQIRATVNDDLGLSGTDTSGNFEIVGTIPPSITLTRPTGGETWYAGTNEDIMWSTTAGDGTITGINLDYSIDGGASWTNIVTGTADDGVHTWLVPDEATIEAQIRATVNDDLGLSDTDTSGNFAIIGTPPTSPTGLTVEHYGAGDAVELVDNGIFDTNYDPWTLTRVQDEGDARWDADNYVEGGSIYVTAEQTGDGTADEEAYWEQSIGPTSDEITVNAAYRIYASTERGCGVDTTVELRVHDTNTGWQTIYTETINLGVEDIHDPGWLVFGPDATYAPDGDVDAVMAYMHVHADGNTHPGQGAQTATGDAWMDAISIEAAGGGGSGTDDNAVNWTASTDDPAKVTHYNIYRSDVETGPWDATTLIDTVTADGSVSYSYIDTGRGTADTTLWWYVVRAEDEHGQTDGNSNAVQEPGEETITFDIDLFAGGNADGWNFVSFNLELGDTNLETILADIEGSYDKVMYYDASAGQWQSYVPGRAAHYNNIDTWNHHMGLWIHATVDDTLTVEGSAPMSTDITLYPGWNMVGLPSNTAGTGQTHGLPQDVSRIGYFDATNEYNIAYNYDPQNFEFNPGQGYMVYLDHTEPVIWTVDY